MKTALVTCADRNFLPGLEQLNKTIVRHNDMSGIDKILITPDLDEFEDYRILRPGPDLFEVPVKNERFRTAYYKLMLFSLTGYSRVVFIDADIICFGNILGLFHLDYPFWAAKDDGIRLNNIYCTNYRFNSGVMSVGKELLTADTYHKMIQIAKSGLSYDSGDQGVINEYMYISKVPIHFLPMQYNTLKRIYIHHRSLWDKIRNEIVLLHYVGDKPWAPTDNKYNELNNLWRVSHEIRNAESNRGNIKIERRQVPA